ncbi:VanZ family protein [Rhizomicrobium palustre]|uniref:VanZ family protein n=1 Tax=Rhizomicrobium palustre TaxID=189966 RepID=A0A846MZ26_9PROT|nr:VanZ family protein [Rhizomicrobium palustre]NIK88210.1 VanZ family protein [Rhizomicrobium palustre]
MREKLLKAIRLVAVVLFWPAVALVAWGELAKTPGAVEGLVWDKALHFTAYFGLSGMICLAFQDWRRVLAAAVNLALFAGALEILQAYTGRDPDFFDEIANCLGILAGTGLGFLILWLLTSKPLVKVHAR